MKTVHNWTHGLMLPLFVFFALPGALQAQFTFTISNGAITITQYIGTNSTAVIPSMTNGLPVTSIAARAFGGPAVPTDRRTQTVVIPHSITNIAPQEFTFCAVLTAIMVDPANPVFSSQNGVLFDKGQNTIIQFPLGVTGSYTVPASVTNIGADAFHGSLGLTNVALPDSVINIGTNAFTDSGLQSITLGANLRQICPEAFQYCGSLISVAIPNSVTNIGYKAFELCNNLVKVSLPNGITSIEFYLFSHCSSLTHVTIPSGVTIITNGAFTLCTNLHGIYFQGNAPGISWIAFDSASATLYYLPNTTGWTNPLSGFQTVLWNPVMQTTDGAFGVQANQFGFNITGTTNIPIVVEASTNFGAWMPLQSVSLTNGTFYFSDPQWTNYPSRFYRIRSP